MVRCSSQPENINSQLAGLNKPGAVPQPPARSAVARPSSDLSIMSDFSSLTSLQPDNASIITRQSVNEILSMADISVYSGELDNLSVNTLLQSPLGLTGDMKVEAGDTAGSKDSPSSQIFSPTEISEQNTNTMEGLDLDIGQIHDDVMQCVYDDVNIKYDDVEILTDQSPATVSTMSPSLPSAIQVYILERPVLILIDIFPSGLQHSYTQFVALFPLPLTGT